jgi:hypothetical protein
MPWNDAWELFTETATELYPNVISPMPRHPGFGAWWMADAALLGLLLIRWRRKRVLPA